VLAVVRSLCSNVDDVDVRICAECLVAAMGGWDPVCGSELLGTRGVPRRDGGDAGAGHILQGFHPVGGDRAGADNPPPQPVGDIGGVRQPEPHVEGRGGGEPGEGRRRSGGGQMPSHEPQP
jgi:hypothetical protein